MLRPILLSVLLISLWPTMAFSVDRTFLLTWKEHPGNIGDREAATYDVGWSTTPGPPYTLSIQGDADGIVQTNTGDVDPLALSHVLQFEGLTVGQQLYFAVRSVGVHGGVGDWGDEVVHVILDDLDVPNHKPTVRDPLLRIVNNDFSLLWANPSGNTGDKEVAYYVLGVADTPGGPYSWETVSGDTLIHQWQFPDAVPGDSKYFVVQACNGNGICSDKSAEAAHTVPDVDERPNPPTFLMIILR